MKTLLIVFFVVIISPCALLAQDLNWNTVTYTTGSLSTGFGSIGTPASTVSLNITGSTARIDAGFPTKYTANPPGSGDDCAVNCALRSVITFATLAETIVYTFTFSPAVSGLSFRIYDIDGDNTSGDRATVTASGPSGAQNITMSNLNTPASTIAGSGTTSASATGTQGNTGDHQTQVSISGFVNTLTITYANNPANPSAGNRSFSFGNLSWAGTLPVKWISFTGKKQNNGSAELKWITENEINADKYIVEKSKDGQNFVSIGELAVTGGISRNTYSFIDPNPGVGNALYRIKQLDIDGRFEYSGIVVIKQNNELTTATVFPNPAKDFLQISLPGNVQLQRIQVFDASGKLIIQSKNSTGKLDISILKPGVYNLQIENTSGEIFRKSFIKQ